MIPEEILKKAEEMGIDVVDVILTAVSKVDPAEALRIRLSLVEKFLNEAYENLSKGDVIQASEKGYKVAEEVIKLLSEKFRTSEYLDAIKEGRWYTYLLSKSSSTLSKKLGNWVLNGWDSAYTLHVWGSHEGKLNVEDVKPRLEIIRLMVEKTREIVEKG